MGKKENLLIKAVHDRNIEMIMNLLKKKGLFQRAANINGMDNNGATPLLVAIERDEEETFKLLIESGADINLQTVSSKLSPLACAAYFGRTKLLARLLGLSANVNTVHSKGLTPLFYALHTPQKKGSGAEGAYIKIREFNNKLNFQKDTKNVKQMVKELIRAKADVNAKATDGSTPLIVASRSGREELVSILLQANAEVDATDKKGATALFHATEQGHAEIVKTLLNAKADVHAKAGQGFTPLMAAVVRTILI